MERSIPIPLIELNSQAIFSTMPPPLHHFTITNNGA